MKYHDIIPLLLDVASFSMKYFILSKVYSDEGGLKSLYHGLPTCMEDNPRALVSGLSKTGRQTVV